MVFEHRVGAVLHWSNDRPDYIQFTLGTIINIKHSETSTSPSPISSDENCITEAENDKRNKCMQTFSKLPRHLDPNIGLTGYLPPLYISYKANMRQRWNIAPYFLDMLPQSSFFNEEDCILLHGGINPSDADDFVLGCSTFEFQIKSKVSNYYGCMMEPRCYHATASTQQFIYVTGGYSPLQRRDGEMLAIPYTDRLDLKSTLWKRCAHMNVARAAHAMVSVRGKLLVFGGRDSNGNILASVEAYDPLVDEWTIINQLPQPTMGSSATFVQSQVWLVGGITKQRSEPLDNCILRDVYCFSPSNCSWSLEPPLPVACAYSNCVSSHDSIWVLGGSYLSKRPGKNTLTSSPCVWKLSLRSTHRTWKMAGTLSLSTHASAAVHYGDNILIFGGISSEEGVSEGVQSFNTITKKCKQISRLPAAVAGMSAVFLTKEQNINKVKCIIHSSKLVSKDLIPKISRPKAQNSKERMRSKVPSMQHESDEILQPHAQNQAPIPYTRALNLQTPRKNSEILNIQLDIGLHQGKNGDSSHLVTLKGHKKHITKKQESSFEEISKDTEQHSSDTLSIHQQNIAEKFKLFKNDEINSKKSQIHSFINSEKEALEYSNKTFVNDEKQDIRKRKPKSIFEEIPKPKTSGAYSQQPFNKADKYESSINVKQSQLNIIKNSEIEALKHSNKTFVVQDIMKQKSSFVETSKDIEPQSSDAYSLHPVNIDDKYESSINIKPSQLSTSINSGKEALKLSNVTFVDHDIRKLKSSFEEISKPQSSDAYSLHPLNLADKYESSRGVKQSELNIFISSDEKGLKCSSEKASTYAFFPKVTYEKSFDQFKWLLSEADMFPTTDTTTKDHLNVQDEHLYEKAASSTKISISKFPSKETIEDPGSPTSNASNSDKIYEETFPSHALSNDLSQEVSISERINNGKSYKVTELYLPDISASHSHYHSERYVSTLEIPLNGSQRTFELKPELTMKTGVVLECRKWKQVEKILSDSV